jgi:uncharacterized protein YggE
VTVTGSAEVTVPPDAATLSIAIRNVSPSPAEAASKTSELTKAVRAALAQMGVPESAIRQTGYWVGPNWEYQDRVRTLSGYAAELTVGVKTGELSQIGKLVEAAVGAGATEIGHIKYTSTVLPQARREALSGAIAQAQLDAAAMAEAAGGTLGTLQYLTTEDEGRPGVVIRGGSANPANTQVQMATPQDMTIRATVKGQWTLLFRH